MKSILSTYRLRLKLILRHNKCNNRVNVQVGEELERVVDLCRLGVILEKKTEVVVPDLDLLGQCLIAG